NAITPPQEVQQAIDDRSRMGVIQDMNKLMQMKTAMAIEKAAENESATGTGMGTGLGFMMPGVMAPYISGAMHPQQQGSLQEPGAACPKCQHAVPADARFCPQCGLSLQPPIPCMQCGKPLAAGDRFCPECGRSTTEKK
ncbi:MAG: zinc ribbon domain-containing protein, partial [Desulfatirhabdiaceae bacterium]|nr:zinc ribbon domain-containing protein [Desulfatirhabdiaceae bacterium]